MSQYRAPKWGTRVTGFWLILYGADQFTLLSFHRLPEIIAIVAIAAGVLILTDH